MQSAIKAVQFRIARPSDKLQELVHFYHQALGLPVIGSFTNHDGYDGVMIGLPGAEYHLEFTQHRLGSACPAPSKDNLLVLYFDEHKEYENALQRLTDRGYLPVAPENPYWEDKSTTFEDPDGWRIVLFRGVFRTT